MYYRANLIFLNWSCDHPLQFVWDFPGSKIENPGTQENLGRLGDLGVLSPSSLDLRPQGGTQSA